MDEALIELRSELPRLRQEVQDLHSLANKVNDTASSIQARTEGLERGLAEECEARYDAEKAMGNDMREMVSEEMQRVTAAIAELRDLVTEVRAHVDDRTQEMEDKMNTIKA